MKKTTRSRRSARKFSQLLETPMEITEMARHMGTINFVTHYIGTQLEENVIVSFVVCIVKARNSNRKVSLI